MNVFNRRKIYFSMNAQQAYELRSKIKKGGIECQLVRKNLSRPTGLKTIADAGSMLVEYQLFVHKKDVEIAYFLMNQPNHF